MNREGALGRVVPSGTRQTHMWSPRHFASHIHVLNREVPFILNITVPEGTTRPSFTASPCSSNHQKEPCGLSNDDVAVGGVLPPFRTVSDTDVAPEPTWTYSRRVLKGGSTPPDAAHTTRPSRAQFSVASRAKVRASHW